MKSSISLYATEGRHTWAYYYEETPILLITEINNINQFFLLRLNPSGNADSE